MNYISNIDTIYILIDIEDYEENNKKLLEYLSKEKEIAKLNVISNASYKHMISINNMTFEILNTGTKGYSYILHNSGYQINIAQYKSKLENFSPLQIRISSEYLWAYGLSDAWSMIYNWIVETFGNVISEKVCRLDLCTHVSDIDLITNHEISYKGNFKKRETFYTGKNISAITFGRRTGKNIYCRIYNKSLEIQEKKQKTWFYRIWKNNNINIKNVWNIEFEIKSELLRSYSINTVHDVLEHLQDLWLFCTNKWLVKVDRTNTRIERCITNNDWLELQKAYINFNSKGMVKREKQIELDAIILIPNIVGNITSYSARKGRINIDEAFSNLYRDTKKYLSNKETSFEEEVSNKRLILNNSEVI